MRTLASRDPDCPPCAARPQLRSFTALTPFDGHSHARDAPNLGKERQQRLELDLGFGQLLGRIGVADDAAARIQVRHPAPQKRAAKRHAELAVLGQVGPADGARRTSRGRAPRAPGSAAARPRAARRPPPAWAAAARPARRPAADPPAGRGSAWRGAGRCGPSRGPGRRPAATHRLTGASVRSIRRATIACSSRSLALFSSCSPRWSSTDGSALRRVVPASATVWARWPSRRTSSSGLAPTKRGLRRAHAPAVAGREQLPERAEHGAGVVIAGGVGAHLAGEHDLLELAGPDPLDRALHGLLVVRRRRGARDPRALRPGPGRGAASAALAQLARPAMQPLDDVRRGVIRLNDGTEGHAGLAALPRQRDLGQHETRRRQARPLRRRAAVRPRTRSRRRRPGPQAGGRVGIVGAGRRRTRSAARSRAAAGHLARSAPAPRASTTAAWPSPASTKPSRSGCSRQANRSSARRACRTAALRSSSGRSTGTVIAAERPAR